MQFPSRLPLLAGAAFAVLLAVPGTIATSLAFTESDVSFDLAPGFAAVVTGSPDGAPEIVDRAGSHRVAGPLTEARIVDLRPRRIVFGPRPGEEADASTAALLDPLLVRTRNGSVLQMQELEVHYRIAPTAVTRALADAQGDAPHQHQRVAALAAVSIRNAYGALDSEEVADALRARDALELTRADLAQRLERHGLELIQVVAPKPRFDREYEIAIEQRKVFEQEAERLESERASFPAQRDALFEKTASKLALTAAQQEEALAVLQGEVQLEIAKLLDDAQRHATSMQLESETRRIESEAMAQQVLAEGAASASSLASEIDSLAAHGEIAIREALVERLKTIQFAIEPLPREERNQ